MDHILQEAGETYTSRETGVSLCVYGIS